MKNAPGEVLLENFSVVKACGEDLEPLLGALTLPFLVNRHDLSIKYVPLYSELTPAVLVPHTNLGVVKAGKEEEEVVVGSSFSSFCCSQPFSMP